MYRAIYFRINKIFIGFFYTCKTARSFIISVNRLNSILFIIARANLRGSASVFYICKPLAYHVNSRTKVNNNRTRRPNVYLFINIALVAGNSVFDDELFSQNDTSNKYKLKLSIHTDIAVACFSVDKNLFIVIFLL